MPTVCTNSSFSSIKLLSINLSLLERGLLNDIPKILAHRLSLLLAITNLIIVIFFHCHIFKMGKGLSIFYSCLRICLPVPTHAKSSISDQNVASGHNSTCYMPNPTKLQVAQKDGQLHVAWMLGQQVPPEFLKVTSSGCK